MSQDRTAIADGATQPERRSIKELVRDAATHGEAVLRGEVRLAIAEAKDEAQSAALRVGMVVAAVAIALLAFILFLGAGLIALAKIMDPALAFVVGAVICLIVAALLMRIASSSSHQSEASPQASDD